MDRLVKFREIFLAFRIDSIDTEIEDLLQTGLSSPELLQACQKCMEEIGKKFEEGAYFLPELVMAGEMFKKVSARLRPHISPGSEEVAGKIVLGTPKGDLHSLGKDIFGMLAEASGFVVHNLGVDVAPETFVEKLKETGAPILGMSALITTAFDPMQEVVRLLEEEGIRERTYVIIGGGVTTKDMVGRLKVDAQTWDAYEGLRIVQSFMDEKEETK
ncbi:MAG: cobalamin-dependent protein [Deltaproteobacteria bacterium]|nr:MAG: cobalamin-dependent protein [Deltaproteobacteria bacterium]